MKGLEKHKTGFGCFRLILTFLEISSEPFQTSGVELFAKKAHQR